MLVSGAEGGSIRLWDAARAQLRVQSESTTTAVQAVSWSPDGKTIASADLNYQITLWNVFEERSIWGLRTLAGHTAAIQSVAWSPDGSMLASGGNDHTVRLWDPANGIQLRMVNDPDHSVQIIAWSPDSKTLAISNMETITLWDVSHSR
jgi:WD40 repeat protein